MTVRSYPERQGASITIVGFKVTIGDGAAVTT
jgi:hypothetical protein